MALTWQQIRANALEFSYTFRNAAAEEQMSQSFLAAFLAVFGQDAQALITSGPDQLLAAASYEYKVPLGEDKTGYIDFFWKGKIAIEMKSRGKNLDRAEEQLLNYIYSLPAKDMPPLLMICDLAVIRLIHRETRVKIEFPVSELENYVKHFAEIAGYEPVILDERLQEAVNVQSARILGDIYSIFEKKKFTGHDLEVFLLRVVFCAFCEDTGLFEDKSFASLVNIQNRKGLTTTALLTELFKVLNMEPEMREAFRDSLPNELLAFPYLDGGLFEENTLTPPMSLDIVNKLAQICRMDWRNVSPAIFGAMFQSIGDKEKRRLFGEHYTSEENILKVIKPLFLDDLRREFDQAKSSGPGGLKAFHDKIASLKFLDPACGCGNFLIVAYRELRKLELDLLHLYIESGKDPERDIRKLCRVSIEQFYGIEINGFPVEIAKAGMWMTEHQLNRRAAKMFGKDFINLPLKRTAHIIQANALQMDWSKLVKPQELNYIFGNPPFAGRRYRTPEQIKEIAEFFDYKDIDYVCCWYKKAAKMMRLNNKITTAFVSTNSIVQGEQVAALWKPLLENNIQIDYAYRTFKWSNEATGKAAVHCVIIGLSNRDNPSDHLKFIVDEDGIFNEVDQINGYLLAAPQVLIKIRSKPLCDAPQMRNGNVPLDGDALKIEPEDLPKFKDCPFVKRLMGAQELLHNEKRYVLWLINIPPDQIKNNKAVYERVEQCRKNRLAMKDATTRKLAEKPTQFRDTFNPDKYMALPMVSSEKRKYIPMAYLDGNVIPTNQVQIIPDATLYHFGILTSSTHMAWMRVVAGRLEMRYRYSKDIVYNNFPWPEADEKQKEQISKLAQKILDARNKFPGQSLASLYDPVTMPPALQKAHAALDKAVIKLYGWKKDITEPEIVANLMRLYQKLTA